MVEDIFSGLQETLQTYKPAFQLEEIGMVTSVGSGVAIVEGLPGVEADEILMFPGNLFGIAADLQPDSVGAILLDESDMLEAGAEVRRTGRVFDIPVGEGLLGRVVDALGRPLDNRGPVKAEKRLPVERQAPAIMQRLPVTVPFQTGIKAIDAMVPVGRGQRELILGDRQTGKSALALAAVMNQKNAGVICVYCSIGQQSSAAANLMDTLERFGTAEFTSVVVATGDEPPGLRYVTPYAATSIAEHFMLKGKDVLIVYDDLTRHAWAYRELSLLLRRPPGREAYPGDIFYIHSRLLERATHLKSEYGGGSLTALPIIETEAQNIAAYIPTNLISITDGQIYLSPRLFSKGTMPAVDVGRSVSRVGGKAQLPAYRLVAGDLRLFYAQFEELEKFSRFSTRLDEATLKTLERGRRVREVLKQSQYDLQPADEQIAVLFAATSGILDDIPLEKIGEAERLIREAIGKEGGDISRSILEGKELNEQEQAQLKNLARKATDSLRKEQVDAKS